MSACTQAESASEKYFKRNSTPEHSGYKFKYMYFKFQKCCKKGGFFEGTPNFVCVIFQRGVWTSTENANGHAIVST